MNLRKLLPFPLALLCSLALTADVEAGPKKPKAKVARRAKTALMTVKVAKLTPKTPKQRVMKLHHMVKKVRGVRSVLVSKKKGELLVRHTKVTRLAAIKSAVARSGFSVVEPKPAHAVDSGSELLEPGGEMEDEEPDTDEP